MLLSSVIQDVVSKLSPDPEREATAFDYQALYDRSSSEHAEGNLGTWSIDHVPWEEYNLWKVYWGVTPGNRVLTPGTQGTFSGRVRISGDYAQILVDAVSLQNYLKVIPMARVDGQPDKPLRSVTSVVANFNPDTSLLPNIYNLVYFTFYVAFTLTANTQLGLGIWFPRLPRDEPFRIDVITSVTARGKFKIHTQTVTEADLRILEQDWILGEDAWEDLGESIEPS